MAMLKALNPLAAQGAAPASAVWHSLPESASDLDTGAPDVNDFGSTLGK